MLCGACEAIFQDVYLLGSNRRLEWKQDVESLKEAQAAGCQICNFLSTHFPEASQPEKSILSLPCSYAFELHNADWARFGLDPEYLQIEVAGDDTEEFAEERAGKALSRYGSDYNVHKLRYLLKKQCHTLISGEIEMWAVLAFHIAGQTIRFPLQVHQGKSAFALIQGFETRLI
jgi:hypothetical protein